MISRGVSISYGDFALGAKENFQPVSDDSKFETINQLKEYNLIFKNYGNPCDLYSVVLDGRTLPLPSIPENHNIGFWSEQISDDDGAFQNPVIIELSSENQYSSQGLTLTFDTENGVYANSLRIKWSRIIDGVEEILSEKDFTPTSAFYFCHNFVENYNKIVIEFYSINMPENRLKLRSIDYGYGTIFEARELRGTNIIQEIDPISSQIAINTADFVLDSHSNIEYSFQAKQPLKIYFNGELQATTFVKSSNRRAKFLWQVQSEDYIGILAGIPYHGGIYTNAKAVDVLADIFATAKVPYEISEEFNDSVVTGYIPYTSCRDALMQVAFAIQAVVDTSKSEVVKVFSLDEEIKQTIPLKRTMQGQSFTDEETVTGVEIVSHSFKPVAEEMVVYDENEKGVGENIFIKFSEPLHDLSITNGEIISFGTNYAVINSREGCVLRGQKYEHTKETIRKNNPLILDGEIEKIVAVENATLVSASNIDNVMEKCYNWIMRRNMVSLGIVEGKHVKYGAEIKYGQKKYGSFKYGGYAPDIVTFDQPVTVGEKIKAETQYLGVVEGIVTRQSYNLNGNIIIKRSEMR